MYFLSHFKIRWRNTRDMELGKYLGIDPLWQGQIALYDTGSVPTGPLRKFNMRYTGITFIWAFFFFFLEEYELRWIKFLTSILTNLNSAMAFSVRRVSLTAPWWHQPWCLAMFDQWQVGNSEPQALCYFTHSLPNLPSPWEKLTA